MAQIVENMSSIRYDAGPVEEVKTPILTSVYRLVGGLCVIAAGLAVVIGMRDTRGLGAGISAAAICLFAALVCFGIAQVVMLIAKIEYNTRRDGETGQILKALREIAKNTESKPKV